MNEFGLPPCTVVRSATHVEIELLKLPSVEVHFSSQEQEARYQQIDARLADQIHAVALASVPTRAPEDIIYTSEDWSPNRSRALSLDVEAFSLSLVMALLSLLDGTYIDWRIHLAVYKSLATSSEDFGIAFISRHQIIIQSNLYERFSTGT